MFMDQSQFPAKALEHVFSFIRSDKDRNAVSLVCKSWYEIERRSRRHIFVGNCYAVNPTAVTRRFPDLRSVKLKGKPHFADFGLVPEGWGGHVSTWIQVMSKCYPRMEEIRLKRMVVTDESLEMMAVAFPDLKVLVVTSCDGFSTDGLAPIAANCRYLRELELQECEVEDMGDDWLSYFPDTNTSLVSLNFSCLDSEVSFSTLERLVNRCPNLKSLRLNRSIPIDSLESLLRKAPQLVELGTGDFSTELQPHVFSNLSEAFTGCKQLKSFSGFWDVIPENLLLIYSICPQITSLNLSSATIDSADLIKLLGQCPKLQTLWVMDFIEDSGLEVVAAQCKDLQELRVFPSDPFGGEANVTLTEQGLVRVSEGCPKLDRILYFCRQFTNAALVTIARNRPNLTCFRLCIMDLCTPDYLTLEPLDVGFGAIVEHCKDLQRLSISGLLTDEVFEYIGKYANKLEMLSIAFAGDSDMGLHHLLSGCESLRKLEIRDCPFGEKALLDNAAKLETLRFLWMSSCCMTFEGCKLLGQNMPRLNVEVIDERGPPDSRPEICPVETVYVYRTVAGTRSDTPDFVWIMEKDPKINVSRLAIS